MCIEVTDLLKRQKIINHIQLIHKTMGICYIYRHVYLFTNNIIINLKNLFIYYIFVSCLFFILFHFTILFIFILIQ